MPFWIPQVKIPIHQQHDSCLGLSIIWGALNRVILSKHKMDSYQKLLSSQGTSRYPNADKENTYYYEDRNFLKNK